ncbi:MAG: DUF935 family protein [Geminicoccaceae bacterium]
MDELPTRPPLGEVASAGRTAYAGGFVEPLLKEASDPLLRARGFDLTVYEDVLRDDQVKATFQQRRLAVISAEWEIDPGDESPRAAEAADFIRQQLDRIRFDDATDKMAYGLFYGWSVAELIWAVEGGRVVLDAIKVRDRKRFRFDRDGQMRLILPGKPEGEILPQGKFWSFVCGADHDDAAYGLGLAYWLYWPVYFKRNGLKLWLQGLDKWGAPTAVGHYPPGASDEEQKKLLDALTAIRTDSAVILPEGMTAELLEAAKGAASHDAMLARMDAAIAKIVLSQTMTTDNGSSLSQASVHMDVREEVVTADADLICASFVRDVVRPLTLWNFGPDCPVPQVWRVTEPPEDIGLLADRDLKLKQLGWQPTEERIREIYGDGYERVAAPVAPEPPVVASDPTAVAPGQEPSIAADQARDPAADPTTLSETACPGCGAELADGAPSRDAADDVADQLAKVTEAPQDALIGRIQKLLAEAPSLEALRDGLLEAYGELDPTALADAVGAGLVTAELVGRAEVADGD